MKIEIDYYLWHKESNKIARIRHTELTEEDIINLALEKYKELYSDYEYYNIEASIAKTII